MAIAKSTCRRFLVVSRCLGTRPITRYISRGLVVALFYAVMPLVVAAADRALTDQVESPEWLDASLIREAFIASSQGYSSDELLIRDSLRDSFLHVISQRLGRAIDEDLQRAALLKLLALRKAGKLDHPATKRSPPADADLFAVAEIASRIVMDRHRVTSDTMLADPRLRSELQQEAEKVISGVDAYAVRKGVLSLRKRRQLKPELVLKVVQWPREVQSMRLSELRLRVEQSQLPAQPGIYLFRDETGYLYIGEADRLSRRLAQHVAGSDRASLAEYLSQSKEDEITVELHIFPSDSPARQVIPRRAYESELIRSRSPKFNVRP